MFYLSFVISKTDRFISVLSGRTILLIDTVFLSPTLILVTLVFHPPGKMPDWKYEGMQMLKKGAIEILVRDKKCSHSSSPFNIWILECLL